MGVSDASTQRRNDEQTIRTGRGTSGQKEPKRTGTVVETMQIRTELLDWNEWLECLTVSGQNGLLTAKLAPFLVRVRGPVLLIPPGMELVTPITVAFIPILVHKHGCFRCACLLSAGTQPQVHRSVGLRSNWTHACRPLVVVSAPWCASAPS